MEDHRQRRPELRIFVDAEMEMGRHERMMDDEQLQSRSWNLPISNLPSDDCLVMRLQRMIIEGDVERFKDETHCIKLTEFRGAQGNTVLHMAAMAGRTDLITVILDESQDLIKIKNSKGELPLHVAAATGELDSVKYLVDWIEGNEGKDHGGASRNRSRTKECRGEHGTHPNQFQEQQQQGDDRLISSGINISIHLIGEANEDSETALHIALENHNEEVAEYLVQKYPAASYHKSSIGICPLYLAIKAGNQKLVELMLKGIGEKDVKDHLLQGKSVVHAAIMANNTDLLSRMLSCQPALIEVYDEEGRTPLSYAAFLGRLDAVRYFLKEFPDYVYKVNKDCSFPIHKAAQGGHVRVMVEFLSHLPSTIMNLVNRDGHSIFHLASRKGRADMVSYLLRIQGVEKLINSRDKDGNTPLHLAVVGKHAYVVSILTWDERVKLHLQNKVGMTALDAAEYFEGSTPNYEQRLVWLALRHANAPRRPQGEKKLNSDEVPKHGNPTIEPPNLDNYKDRVNTLLLVSTLVATVTFAAGFTVPGGYSSSGTAIFADRRAFQTFVIINTIALYSSILADVALIWTQLGDLRLTMISLKFGVGFLGLALTMMSVAFMVGVYLLVNGIRWLSITILVMGSIFLVTILLFFIPVSISLSSAKYRFIRYIIYIPFRMMLFLIRDEN